MASGIAAPIKRATNDSPPPPFRVQPHPKRMEWDQGVFSDESRFNFSIDDNRIRVCMPHGERLNLPLLYSETLLPRLKHGWGNRCRRLIGFQMLNDDEIVISVKAESDPVDDETDEDEDNNESRKDPSNAGAFSALETAMEWYEQQSE
ncbi:hypothetical protein TNCV_1860001 [Trichonephila clavipes]|nr:hypothetical protein TNCV_1860001 [Trichonephila clavipes]